MFLFSRTSPIELDCQASNWVLKKIKANRWLPFLVFLWGVVTTLSGLVENFAGLVAVRFVLGACEGGILPGIVSVSFFSRIDLLQLV